MQTKFFSVKRLAQFYAHHIANNPLKTQSATAGTLFLIGDLMCQTIEYNTSSTTSIKKETGFELDWMRTAKMASFGYLFGPASYFWYRLLDKKVVFKSAAKVAATAAPLASKVRPNVKTVVSKVVIDEMLFSPACIVSLFGFVTLLNGGGFGDISNKLKNDFGRTFVSDMCVWVPAQTVNFYFVPTLYRVLFVSFISVFWNCYLSFMTNRVTSENSSGEEQKTIGEVGIEIKFKELGKETNVVKKLELSTEQ